MSDPTTPAPPTNNPTWREQWRTYTPSLRYWLIPAVVALVVLTPLMRNALPVTQLGLIPTDSALAEALDISISMVVLPFRLLILNYPQSLAFIAIGVAFTTGLVGTSLWRGHGWWVTSLTLTLPFLISTVYQRGNLTLLTGWTFFSLFLLILLMIDPRRGKTQFLLPTIIGLNLLFLFGQLILTNDYLPLHPYQLFLSAWADPLNWREWVEAPSFQIGVVPVVLGVLTLLAALPRRQERTARLALILIAIATIFALLTLFPGPVLVWLVVALSALILAIGALPLLDTRYAALPVQIGIVAIAVLTIYPYLQPAWFDNDTLETHNGNTLFGGEMVWLARVNVTRADETLTVETWWQALQPVPQNYSVFVHFVNDQEAVIAQADALLVDKDNMPTTQWAEGYVVYQKYEATVTEPIQEIRVGVYDVATLQRLPMLELYRFVSGIEPSSQDYLSLTEIP